MRDSAEPLVDVVIRSESVPGPVEPVQIRVYEPAEPRGAGLLWIHGGGFVEGDLDMPEADAVSRAVAARGITVVSSHYRLAIGNVVFPALSDDVMAVWRWVVGHRPGGVAPEAWSVGGASAGATLASSICLQSRDGKAQLPRSAVLVYPSLHGELIEPSYELAAKLKSRGEGQIITAESHAELSLNYVGEESLLHHPYAFPGEGRLEGFPPTLIINAEYDSLRASGERFGSQLVTAGVDCTVLCMPGAEHAFLNDPGLASFALGTEQIAHWLCDCALLSSAREGPREAEDP